MEFFKYLHVFSKCHEALEQFCSPVSPATFSTCKVRLISTVFSNFTANQGKSEVYASPSRDTDRQILLPWRRYPPMGHSSGEEIQRFRATDAEVPR